MYLLGFVSDVKVSIFFLLLNFSNKQANLNLTSKTLKWRHKFVFSDVTNSIGLLRSVAKLIKINIFNDRNLFTYYIDMLCGIIHRFRKHI